MSMDHEDIERIENIEDKIRTIEQRLDNIDETREQKIQDINEQMEQTIDKLPIGIRGMVKKIVEGKTEGENNV